MSTNTDTTNQTSGSSNTTLVFIFVAVFLGVVFYILIRYGSSLISEWHQHFDGTIPAQAPALGLSPSDIEAFPTFIYRGATRYDNNNNHVSGNQNGHSDSNCVDNGIGMVSSKRHGVSIDCSICLCDLQEDDLVRMLPPCRHFFHIQCIDVWLYAHPSCPICRARMQTESVALNECSMSLPLPHLHQWNNLQGTDADNIQATTEEVTTSGEITEIVVEQEEEMARNIDQNSKRRTGNESIVVQIDVNDEVNMEMGTKECSDKTISTNEPLLVSNIGSPSKRVPSLGSPMDEEMQKETNQEILETTTINDLPVTRTIKQ